MKIALLGAGKMGCLIEQEALKHGHQIISKTGRSLPSLSLIQQADICIDFSHADAVYEHTSLACKAGKNIVIGTTGWEDQCEMIQNLALTSNIGVIASPNYSLGVQLFKMIVAETANLLKNFCDYDVSGYEIHHKYKLDAPSGTAKMLAQTVAHRLGERGIFDFSSVRCGSVPGTHTLIFDSEVDTILLTHEARSRNGFAKGALEAATWLIGKRGFYSIEDMIGEALCCKEPLQPLSPPLILTDTSTKKG
jgi:4-hydroxy-tetrahydrodipicolinate reductase